MPAKIFVNSPTYVSDDLWIEYDVNFSLKRHILQWIERWYANGSVFWQGGWIFLLETMGCWWVSNCWFCTKKTFSKANQPSKEMPITFQFKKREKFSCIFKTYKLFFGKQHFTKALWYYFISEIMKLGTQLAPTCMCVPLR